jgi:glucose-6-phosphate isomerase
MALRQNGDTPLLVDGSDVIPGIRAVQARMKEIATQIRAGHKLGATGQPIRAVVNIGIGGSDLGPLLVCDALAAPTGHGRERADVEVAFVSNVDPEHLTRALARSIRRRRSSSSPRKHSPRRKHSPTRPARNPGWLPRLAAASILRRTSSR